ncbi:alpha-L-rhamnosidase [bacterium A37T11]|nr:alpha-L-rhamnosidase [bacterium A37T11]
MTYRILFLLLLTQLLFCFEKVSGQSDLLKSGFKNPPNSSKARTWWHWLNGNVSKAGITADLEAMKRVGIQEAQIFNVDMGYPEGTAVYLSEQWLEMVQFAASEAKRLGLELGFANSAGWSSSGGPWVKPEQAMQTVVYSEVQISDVKPFNHQLPQPPTRFDYYKDIAVLAFPTPKTDLRIDQLSLKSLSGALFRTNIEPDDQVIPNQALVKKSSILNLTAKLSANGRLDWDPPSGNWTILRIGHTPTGAENHPAVAGGKGLECDKLSKKALDAYWQGGVMPILDKLGPLAGSVVTNCVVDSYEVGCGNWTSLIREEFLKLRGYDCLDFLPTLAGYYVESGEISERFLWDFRKTVSDLMADNYYGHFSELCHQNGLKFSAEPYGGPFESQRAGATPDMVMGEFWLSNRLFLESPRLAASISHLRGNHIVGAESFTGFGGWINYPGTMKPVGDRVWAEGINRFIFHTYVHQPWNVPPGLSFGNYGVEMNRMNTWWELSKPYMDYLGRAQFLLQQGQSFADVLVFNGESVPNNGILRTDIKELGYDYDQIGLDQLLNLQVKDGKIYTSKSGPYQLLVLPNSRWASPLLLKKLKYLVDAGAVIIGAKPKKSPSLTGYPQCDQESTVLANDLWPSKIQEINTAEGLVNLLEKSQVAPDFSAGKTGNDLNFIHRKFGDDDIYFIANPQERGRTEFCQFRISGKKPQLWDAETGQVTEVFVWKELAGGVIQIPLSFTSHGAEFVVFSPVTASSAIHITSMREELDAVPPKQLRGLRVIKAEYGIFLPDGVVDVTASLAASITKHGLNFSADNGLSTADPAPGSMKELRIKYEAGGTEREVWLLENEHRSMGEDTANFKLKRALYGKFGEDFRKIPPKYPVYDVTEKVKSLMGEQLFSFTVSDSLFNVPSASDNKKNALHIIFETDGELQDRVIQNGHFASFEQERSNPYFVRKDGVVNWVTPRPGKLGYTTSTGVKKIVNVKHVSEPIEISGPWDVEFPKANGGSNKLTFNSLTSWSLSSESEIRYFSGTAVYKKQVFIPDKVVRNDNPLELDLGNVKVIAEVLLNGKRLATLWKAPYRIKLDGSVHRGLNDLEIRVTNLWPNRLIGDEHYQDDGIQQAKEGSHWPDWLLNTAFKRNSERTTFTTHKYYAAPSELQLSGLLGPVVFRSYQHVAVLDL